MLLSVLRPSGLCSALGLLLALPALGAAPTAPDSLRPSLPPPQRLVELQVVAPSLRSAPLRATPHFRWDSLSLRQQGVSTMADALRRLPGVQLRDYGGAGGLKTITVRGLGAAHTLVVIDGMPQATGINGQADFSHFPLHRYATVRLSVADAEALLLPASALGAAVVDLRSREHERQVGLTLGSFGQWQPEAVWTWRRGRSQLSAFGSQLWANNAYPYRLRNLRQVTQQRRHHSALDRSALALSLRHALRNGTQLRTQLTHQATAQQLPGPVWLYAQQGTEQLSQQHTQLQVQAEQSRGAWQWTAAAQLSLHHRRYEDRDGKYPQGLLLQTYRHHDALLSFGLQRSWHHGLALALSTDLSQAALRSNLNADNRVQRLSLHSALSLRYATPRLTTTARLLAQLHRERAQSERSLAVGLPWQVGEAPQDVAQLSPSLSALLMLADRATMQLRLRAHYRHALRLPSFVERYYYHYGSQRLRPEHTQQIGLGLLWNASPRTAWLARLALTADAYYNQVRDRIVALPVSTALWRTANYGRVVAAGMDLSLTTQHELRARQRLLFAASYTLQSVRDRQPSARGSYGLQLPYTPLHTASAALTWEHPWLSLGLQIHGASQRYATPEHALGTALPPYMELGATAYRSLQLCGQRFQLRLVVSNLLSQQYEHIHRYPLPLRSWQCALMWQP